MAAAKKKSLGERVWEAFEPTVRELPAVVKETVAVLKDTRSILAEVQCFLGDARDVMKYGPQRPAWGAMRAPAWSAGHTTPPPQDTPPPSEEDHPATFDRERAEKLTPAELLRHIKTLIQEHDNIQAIKLRRLATGESLKDAKAYVDNLAFTMKIHGESR